MRKKVTPKVNPSYFCIPLKAIILYSTPTSHHTITIHLLKEQRHPVEKKKGVRMWQNLL